MLTLQAPCSNASSVAHRSGFAPRTQHLWAVRKSRFCLWTSTHVVRPTDVLTAGCSWDPWDRDSDHFKRTTRNAFCFRTTDTKCVKVIVNWPSTSFGRVIRSPFQLKHCTLEPRHVGTRAGLTFVVIGTILSLLDATHVVARLIQTKRYRRNDTDEKIQTKGYKRKDTNWSNN